MEERTGADAAPPSGGRDGAMVQMVPFRVGGGRYALPVQAVERVVAVVEITPLPKAPEIVLGIVNLAGRVIPVVDTHRRFGQPHRELSLTDKLIVANTSRRPVALLADQVEGVVERQVQEVTPTREILPGIGYVRGVVKLGDGLVLIHDLNTFLSLEEEGQLREALEPGPSRP